MARGAKGNGEEILQPLWCRISLWISAVKRKRLGESSDGPSHYPHVPSEMEEALAGSFVYGLGLGMVAAALTVATSFLVIDADSMHASQSANGLPLDPVVRSAPRAPPSGLLLHRPCRVPPPRAHSTHPRAQWMLALVNASLSLLVITNLTVVARISWGVVLRMIKRSYDAGKGEANTQMPEGLSHAEKHLWQVFQLADVDGSNSLDIKEFENALRKGHYDFSQAELEEMLAEVDQDRSGKLEFKEFGRIATRLSMMRIPEAALLGRLLLFEQLVWGLVHTFGLVCSKPLPRWPSRCGNPNPTPNLNPNQVYMYAYVGPPEIWERADDNLFAYFFIVYLRDGVMYPSLRRQFYFFPCFVFLICSLPFTIFKVRSGLISQNLPNASPTALRRARPTLCPLSPQGASPWTVSLWPERGGQRLRPARAAAHTDVCRRARRKVGA